MPRSATSDSRDAAEPTAASRPAAAGSRSARLASRAAVRGALGGLAAGTGRLARASLAPAGAPARGLLAAARLGLRTRVRTGDLDDRDSLLVRDVLPLAWMVAGLWFRAEVRGLHHVPRDEPVLLVGNHSGGTLTPDSFVFALGFASHFGPERPLHVLVHNLVSAYPGLGVLRRLGTLPAEPALAQEALAAGSCVLVYPGGEREAYRPSTASARIVLGEDPSWVRLALESGVPVVPVVAIGGQETALFLGDGRRLAERTGLDRALGVQSLPLAVAPPWGLNVGGLLGHVPLPAKIVVQVLPPIDVPARFGRDADPREVHDHVAAQMQEMLSELARRRRLPVLGWERR